MKSLQVVYSILSSNAQLTALVGNKIYPLRIAQHVAFPGISFQQISSLPHNSKSSYAKTEKVRVQINSFAIGLDEVNSIAEKVRTAMEIPMGQLNTISGFVVQGCTFENEYLTASDNASEEGVFWVQQDYFIYLNRN